MNLPRALTAASLLLIMSAVSAEEKGFVALFPEEGPVKDWLVRDWADITNPAPEGTVWEVKDGVLHGSEPRGTWLISSREYENFVLEYEFKLGPKGNSGCGLRFPLQGDPAFDGLEMQMVDPRYYGDATVGPAELTSSLYTGVAGKPELYKPEAWNTIRITCDGSKVKVELNGESALEADLEQETRTLERGTPLKDRPRKGHIGFQELSRGGGHVMIRNARIKELE